MQKPRWLKISPVYPAQGRWTWAHFCSSEVVLSAEFMWGQHSRPSDEDARFQKFCNSVIWGLSPLLYPATWTHFHSPVLVGCLWVPSPLSLQAFPLEQSFSLYKNQFESYPVGGINSSTPSPGSWGTVGPQPATAFIMETYVRAAGEPCHCGSASGDVWDAWKVLVDIG